MGKLTSSLISIAALTLLLAPLASAAEVAGKIGYMSGSLIAKRADGTVKIMGPKSEVLAGDDLETSKDSYAQVLMNDGAQMTIRPNSNLKIEAYKFNKDAPQNDNAVFRLLRGGFRTVSGLIGTRGNSDAYKLKAMTATIGIRGTDFTTRLCANQDCEEDPSAAPPQPPVVPQAAGRVMLVQGELTGKDAAGKVRNLVVGSAVYEGEVLSTAKGSYAVVAFRDEGRVTLQEETVFHVETFQYNRQQGQQNNQENAVFRLLKGGVRVVTGLIGRVNHDNYRFKLTTATIGVRGTGFDAWCNAECATGGANPGTTQTEPLKGAGVYVWAGQVALSTTTASQLVGVGQAAILGRDLKPVPVTTIPSGVIQNKTPRPDAVKVDLLKEFENDNKSTPPATPPAKSGGKAEPGVYVTVHDGQVILAQSNQTLNVGKGQTGFANDKFITRLPTIPKFFGGDKQFDSKGVIAGASNKTAFGATQNGCVVK
jgi:hypothetical protein